MTRAYNLNFMHICPTPIIGAYFRRHHDSVYAAMAPSPPEI